MGARILRTSASAIFFALLFSVAAAPVFGSVIATLTLNSNTAFAYSTDLSPDAQPGCPQPYCALFSGTITDFGDADTDGNGYFSTAFVSFPYTTDPGAFGGLLGLDFTSPVGIMSGDPNWAMADPNNPQNVYTGPVFGIDLPAHTPVGSYHGTVYIDFINADTGTVTTLSQEVTVNVLAPEPSAAALLLAGLLPFAALGVRRKWRSSEVLR